MSHLQATQGLACGIHAVPGVSASFAATVGAHRFLNNRRVSLRSLARPLIDAERHEAAASCGRYLLVVHDWSQLMYPEHIDAPTLALWYYWRWSIETYFKLLKSAGMNVEKWQQESAAAIARRLLVASMACVTVWQLARSEHPQAEPVRTLLVRLSGRQMKRGCAFTLPALLAGMWALLAMLEVLETHSVEELRELARIALALPTAQPP